MVEGLGGCKVLGLTVSHVTLTPKGKGRSVPGMSVILQPNMTDGDYNVIIVHKTDYYTYRLNSGTLTDRQRQGNMIATHQWGRNQANQITVDDFFQQSPQ